jgi:hypothetical protein
VASKGEELLELTASGWFAEMLYCNDIYCNGIHYDVKTRGMPRVWVESTRFAASGGTSVRRRGGGEDRSFAAPAFAECAFIERWGDARATGLDCQATGMARRGAFLISPAPQGDCR